MTVVALETHGRAVIVKGDTRPIKDFLKGLGGRWNSQQVGWIYQGSKKAEILSALKANSQVKQVVDKTDGASEPAATPPATATAAPAAAASLVATPQNERSAGKRKAVPAESGGGTEKVINITDKLRATCSSFMGKAGVDIRNFYQDGAGEWKPTPKGVRLGADEWQALLGKVAEIDAASGAERQIEIAGDVVATVKPDSVDIRKFYTDKKDGELKPTKKGCWLSRENWATLKSIAAQLSDALGTSVGAASSSPAKKRKSEAAKPKAEVATAPEPDSADDAPLVAADQGAPSPKRLKKEIAKLLEGRDLEKMSLKSVRKELAVKLSIKEELLNERKEEITEAIKYILRKREHTEVTSS